MTNYLILFLVTALFSTSTLAQESNSNQKVKQTVAMSPEVGNKLLEAQKFVEESNYSQALAILDELRNKPKLSPYETAQVWNLTAYTHYSTEDYTRAVRAYENVLAQPDLPDALVQSTLRTISQLYFLQEDYDKALSTVQRLIALLEEPGADVLILLGQAYYQNNQYRQALEPIQSAVDKVREQGRKPKENWLLLLRVIHYELGDYRGMVAALKQLINEYPKDQYVYSLAGAYSELGNTKQQMALTEVLYEKGLLEGEQHLVNLANLYLLHETPYKAAKLLEKEISAANVETTVRNLRLLSQSWYQAREYDKSIPPLERAAELSEDGELNIRLAQSYMDTEQWNKAVQAVRTGLDKGGLKRADTANLMLGMSLFNLQQLQPARSAFQLAARDNRSAPAANQWLSYINSELRRIETMQQVLPEEAPKERDALLDVISDSGS